MLAQMTFMTCPSDGPRQAHLSVLAEEISADIRQIDLKAWQAQLLKRTPMLPKLGDLALTSLKQAAFPAQFVT